ncbi:hypothetical protein [Clostridium gasigenes]|uniref:hypothetical protein n=1 Tax=Clostridium gasigenes TaxID=94869 RepID=UPI001C0DC53E|nr:hypothetical protein [Clostridium gasigenes]MBU3103962.1 hypothetical protein [Clostridium gasigenes]
MKINQIDTIGVSVESLIYHILEERRTTRVECDDTFFHESFKGGHSENSVFKIPRKAYRRGVET